MKIIGNIDRGKFELIQTTEDHELTTFWSGDKDKEITLEIPIGSSSIKWVRQKTAGELSIQLEAQERLEVEPQADLLNAELNEGGLFGEK